MHVLEVVTASLTVARQAISTPAPVRTGESVHAIRVLKCGVLRAAVERFASFYFVHFLDENLL